MNSLREINVLSDYEIFAFSTLQISSDKISMLKQLQLIHDTLDIGRWLNELEILKNIFIKDNV